MSVIDLKDIPDLSPESKFTLKSNSALEQIGQEYISPQRRLTENK